MRYFLVSDIHGHFDKLIEALNAYGFNENEDTLVSLGDVQDRGTQTLEVIEYMMMLPHKILILGNHEMEFYKKLTHKAKWDHYDVSNGVKATFYSLMKNNVSKGSLSHLEYKFNHCADFAGVKKLWLDYYHTCHAAVEFEDLIACHGWLPNFSGGIYPIDWRNVTSPSAWYEATWCDSKIAISKGYFPEKRLAVGHISARELAHICLKNSLVDPNDYVIFKYEKYSPFFSPKLIALDGALYAPENKVKVYIYESDVTPVFYDIK